jgi:hypothetical protein
MPEHGSELNRSSRGIGLRRAKHGPPVADLLRPIVVVLNAGTVVRVRLDRKVTSAGAGECRLLADFVAEIGIPTPREGWSIF